MKLQGRSENLDAAARLYNLNFDVPKSSPKSYKTPPYIDRNYSSGINLIIWWK